jgi:uncharacterized protein YjbJ (UPF0337 family)
VAKGPIMTQMSTELAGKVQQEMGKLVGSKTQQAKGVGKHISGEADKNYGTAKEFIKDANKH